MASFDQRFGPWFSMRESQNVEDRQNEEYPWSRLSHRTPQYSPTDEETAMRVLDSMQASAPQRLSPLGRAAGVNDIRQPTEEELIRFLINVDMHNAVNETTGR